MSSNTATVGGIGALVFAVVLAWPGWSYGAVIALLAAVARIVG